MAESEAGAGAARLGRPRRPSPPPPGATRGAATRRRQQPAARRNSRKTGAQRFAYEHGATLGYRVEKRKHWGLGWAPREGAAVQRASIEGARAKKRWGVFWHCRRVCSPTAATMANREDASPQHRPRCANGARDQTRRERVLQAPGSIRRRACYPQVSMRERAFARPKCGNACAYPRVDRTWHLVPLGCSSHGIKKSRTRPTPT